MKFNIVSISDKRQAYKDHIRAHTNIEEVRIPSVDGRAVDLREELDKRGLFIPYHNAFSVGEVGIWLSMFDCWQWVADNGEPLIVFEDDALPREFFDDAVDAFLKEIPSDWDFLALWIPDNQRRDYLYDVEYDDEGHPTIHGVVKEKSLFDFGATYLARVYNGYGNVATMFSPAGARFFMDKARSVGLYTPVDCFLYQEAHAGRCHGYAPKPFHATVVDYDWPETTVHTTERFAEVYK